MKQLAPLLALTLAATAACSGDDPSPAAPEAAVFAAAPCPADVDAAILAPIDCGYLTVPEDRREPGRRIRVFVVRVEPREQVHDDPVLVVGTNLGNTPNYGGIAPIAERLGRVAILVDSRGTGHSEPSLACPEVEARRLEVLTAATDDPDQRNAWRDAIGECRQRLEADGVDLDAYTLEAMATDAADLRRALGIDRWTVYSYGTASRISLELLRQDEAGTRAVFLDSPQTEQVDELVEGGFAFDAALDELATRCREASACRTDFGDLTVGLRRAVRRLDREPQVVDVHDASTSQTTAVYVDGTMLLRLVRAVLADGGSSGSLYLPPAVPALVSLAEEGRLDELAPLLVPVVGDDTAYCLGYVPKCAPHMGLSEGAYYSLLCRDPRVVHDTSALAALPRRAGFAAMFGDSPYADLCEVWGERTTPAPERSPVESDVPTLVLTGAFATHTRTSTVREGLGGLSRATFVVNPVLGHNVLVGGCMSEIRRVWQETFTVSRRQLSCLDPALPWLSEAELLETAASAGG